MNRLIECVPNFSEGRDLAKVDAIVEAMGTVRGAWILDRTSDADHNRSVITMAGEPEAVAEAAIRGAGKAASLIDMTRQTGVHPRIGATDVIPFIPLESISVEECVALAWRVGRELWERYSIPVYFYEAAATRPDRVNLENIRRGQFEGLRGDAQRNPDRSPDIGEARLHATAGATAVGVRKLLIAYNIYLSIADVTVAKEIARAIRASSGGLPHVKAIGVEMKSRGLAQVSINLTDFEQTPLHVVFEKAQHEAALRGCAIVGSEIIGLAPRKAIERSGNLDLQLENFSPERILENRLAAMRAEPSFLPDAAATAATQRLQPLVDTLRNAVQGVAVGPSDKPPLDDVSNAHRVAESSPEEAAEAHLNAAFAAGEIYERLVQLEATAAPSILLDWIILKQAAAGAARAAMDSAVALLPSLRDASTAARIKSGTAEIEAKLSG